MRCAYGGGNTTSTTITSCSVQSRSVTPSVIAVQTVIRGTRWVVRQDWFAGRITAQNSIRFPQLRGSAPQRIVARVSDNSRAVASLLITLIRVTQIGIVGLFTLLSVGQALSVRCFFVATNFCGGYTTPVVRSRLFLLILL